MKKIWFLLIQEQSLVLPLVMIAIRHFPIIYYLGTPICLSVANQDFRKQDYQGNDMSKIPRPSHASTDMFLSLFLRSSFCD